NRTTTNKARALIDKVMNKGDEVRLILHLELKDSTLYKHLCQTCDCVIILCCSSTGDSWITHIFRCKFKDILKIIWFCLLKQRGAEKDEENMEKLLSTLGYEVVKHTNLTAKKMENALDDFSKHPKLKETDSVFVVISSHGQYGAVHGVNHKPDEPDVLKVDDIYDNLNAKSCPALVDKPKIIIIQACRGSNLQLSITLEDVLRFTHKEKDFIALLSSTPHSYRHILRGSFLIQFTVDVFQTNLLKDHIEELFRKVWKELPDRRQMPTKDRCTLTRLFFLFPGDLKQ
uniref:Uncharacterized protein n=1 Tax=Neogobius melanostomus TaxID=47308 RepID=A0A8C6SPN5_9GOBI